VNYYRRFPGDYARDTHHLSMAEDGAYTRLLDLAYSSGKPLPTDRKLLHKMTRCASSSDRRLIDEILEQFFTLTRWGWTQKKVRKELRHAKQRMLASQNNGKRGGRPKTHRVSARLAKNNLDESYPKPVPTPEPEPERSSPNFSISQDTSAAEVFVLSPATAFHAIGFDEPFGHRSFQHNWVRNFKVARESGEYLTSAMERTIQQCNSQNIGVPPQFFDAKRDIEKNEVAHFKEKHRTTTH
jgi:uncharacterized protein YdaU (DUF1376 family)